MNGKRKYVILSGPILLEEGRYALTAISMEEAQLWVEANAPENFCGHQTVKILGVDPAQARRSCAGYDEALILKPRSRLEWGKQYTVKQIREIGVDPVLVTKL